jgi:hypothetical protein
MDHMPVARWNWARLRHLSGARLDRPQHEETSMTKPRNLVALVALGALAALPACSDGSGSNQYSGNYAPPSSYPIPSGYSGAGNVTPTNQTVAPVSRQMIRNVQQTLRQNGDYNAQVDGVWGPMTESGVRKWQQAHNLNANGEIDVATLQSMNIQQGNQSGAAYNNNGNAQANGTNSRNGSYQANGNNGPNGANQPNGNNGQNAQANTNYNTAGNHQNGNNYTNNNGQPANTPYPTNQGNPNHGTTANGNNGNTTH